MSLHQSPLQKALSNSRRVSIHPKELITPTKACSDDFLIQLKQNYHERIISLEQQVKQTYKNIETDELLNTMEMSEISKEFRHQRVQEIVGESLMSEKESYIAHLSEVNAQLKADVADAENEVQVVLDELENKKKDEANLKQENDGLKNKIVQLREELEYKEKQSVTTDSSHLSTVARLNYEKEELHREIKKLENKVTEKDKAFNELKHDLEIVQGHFQKIEKECVSLDKENNELKRCLRELEEFRERYLGFEDEFKLAREKLRIKEEELNTHKLRLEESIKEIVQLKERNEVIVQENEKAKQKEELTHKQNAEDLRLKYRSKVKKYQQKIEELTKKNEDLYTHLLGVKNAGEENTKFQEIIKSLKQDIEEIEANWTKKYKGLESNSQKELAECKSRNEVKIKQLESEYQVFMQNKLAEVQKMAKEIAEHRESEARHQYETKLTEISRDYIMRSEHDMILATETDNLKAAHTRAIQALYNEFGKEVSHKIQHVKKQEQDEYTVILHELQDRRKGMETEIGRLKDENKFLLNKKSDQSKLIKQLREEIEAQKAQAKGLSKEIDQTAQDYLKAKTQLETQAKRTEAMEAEMIGLLKKIDDLNKRNNDLEAHIRNMNEELKLSGNAQSTMHENFIQEKLNNDGLLEEIESLTRRCEVATDERNQLIKELEQVKEELSNDIKRLQQRVHDYKREVEDNEKFTKNLLNTNKKLEESVEALQYKEKALKIDLATSQGDYMKLEAKIANQTFDHKLNISKLLKLVSAQIAYIKKEAESIKNSAKFEIDVAHKVTKAAIEDFSKNLSNQLKSVRIRNIQESASRLEIHRKDTEKYQDSLQAYAEENKELLGENDSLNKQLVKALDALDVSKVAIGDYKRKLEMANEEIFKLKDIEVERVAEIEQIKLVVDEQFINLRGELKGRIPEIIKNLQSKHKAEISQYIAEINQLKQNNEDSLAEMKNNIREMVLKHDQDLDEAKRNYQQRVIQGEEKIISLRKQCEAEVQDNSRLRQELKEFKERCQVLDQEQRELIAGYQVKVKEIERTVQKNNESNKYEKDESWKEVERLTKELRDVKRELNLKNEELEDVQRIRNEQHECILKYRSIEQKQKLNTSGSLTAREARDIVVQPFSARKMGDIHLKDLVSSRTSTAASGFYSSRKNY